jgi:hypothetical protein
MIRMQKQRQEEADADQRKWEITMSEVEEARRRERDRAEQEARRLADEERSMRSSLIAMSELTYGDDPDGISEEGASWRSTTQSGTALGTGGTRKPKQSASDGRADGADRVPVTAPYIIKEGRPVFVTSMPGP